MKITERSAFNYLLKVARWALRRHYSPTVARQIERSFRDDPAEIIAVAGRDLQNSIAKRKSGGSRG